MGRIAVAIIVSSWVIPIAILVNHIVPDPYMDEIFHVPQAQQYCQGNFRSWDPKITTPPGLYFLSLAHVSSLFTCTFSVQAALSFSDICSTAILRSTNGVLAVICSILVYEIIKHLRPALDERKATLHAVVLALYPLHWFFTFLYYTDVASLTAVLAMYFLSLRRKYLFSALLGALAVLLRQTNIIWMLLVVCTVVIDCTMACQKGSLQLYDSHASDLRDGEGVSDKGVTMVSSLRKRRFGNSVGTIDHSIPRNVPSCTTHSSDLFVEIRNILFSSWQLKRELVISLSPFCMVLVAFVAFVCWNGSVVLGAKDAHAVSPHFAQLLYFGLVSALFTAPEHFSLSQVGCLARSFWKGGPFSFFFGFVALSSGFLSVHFFSIAHPYLLADNRHYPFYLWRKVIKAHWSMKYLLVPLCVYSWFSISQILAKQQKKIWALVYFLACTGALVPAPLIEFRYYTIPFYFLTLHSNVSNGRSWLLMGILYLAINAFTMIMFLFRPFHWDHEAGFQRFIW